MFFLTASNESPSPEIILLLTFLDPWILTHLNPSPYFFSRQRPSESNICNEGDCQRASRLDCAPYYTTADLMLLMC